MRVVSIWLICIVLAAGFFARVDRLGKHFTHVDSVFMATDILKAKSPAFQEIMIQRAFDQTKPAYNGWYKKAIRLAYSNAALHPLLNAAFFISPYFIVSTTSTNPPLQFFINVPLINAQQSYEQILFWGRLPSCLFSMLGLGLFAYVLWTIFRKQSVVLLGTTIFAFSWQHVIYAKQIYPYALGVFAAVVLLWMFWQAINKRNSLLISAIIPAVLTYGTYQLYFLVPAYYITLMVFFYSQKDKNEVLQIVKSMILYGLLILPGFVYVLLNFTNAAVKYQVGPHGEYMFSPVGRSLFGLIKYAILFFIHNTWLTFRAMLNPVSVYTMQGKIISVTYLSVFGAGIFSIYKSADLKQKIMGVFSLSVLGLWYILALLGKLPLTPCRLSLIYLPFIVYVMTQSILLVTKEFWQTLLVWLFTLVIMALFGFSYHHEMQQRTDVLSEKLFTQLIQKYQVDTVVAYNLSLQFNLMKKVMPLVNYYEEDYAISSPRKRRWVYSTVLFFSTRQPYSAMVYRDMQNRINGEEQIKQKWNSPESAYKKIYAYAVDSPVEIEYTRDTVNGSNDVYITIVRCKK